MKKRVVSVFLAILVLTLLFSGCSLKMEGSGAKELTIYVLNLSPKRWIECDVWNFNFPEFEEAHDGIDIKTVEFSSMDDLEAQLLQELPSGGGPDVIFYSWQNNMNIYKLAADGLFVDLNTYLKNDDGFDRSAYMESLLDSGVFGGAQYLMPVGYMSPILLTSEEKLAAAGVTYAGKPYSGRELMQIIKSEGERLAEDDVHYAFVDFQQGNASSVFFDYSGVINLGSETREDSVDADTLFECMQLHSSFLDEFKRSLNALTKNGAATGLRYSAEELLGMGTFFHETFAPLKEMLQYAFTLQYVLGETPVLQMQPSFNSGDTYYVEPLLAAVNRNSAEPEAAYELIRYLMDHPVRQGADGIAPESYFSVNKSVSTAYLQSVFDTLNPTDSEAWQVVEEQFTGAFDKFLNGEVGFSIPLALTSAIFRPCYEAANESREAFENALDASLLEIEAYLGG